MFIKKPVIGLHYNSEQYEFIAWGDPIVGADFRARLEQNLSVEFIVNNLYGHYYFIYLDKNSYDLSVGNSLFSILPVYYNTSKDKITLTENALSLSKQTGSDTISKRFILETLLFNYPLFNNSIFQEINLLPSNSYLTVSKGRSTIKKHTCIENLFDSRPVPWRKAVDQTSDCFIETVKKYLPDKPYATSLTGGFDGRTLVTAGLYYKRQLSAYSFGTDVSNDIRIAETLAQSAKIPFIKIGLEDDYARNESLECGKEFIINSSGTATFARAHYLFAVKQLSGEFEHIVTGNFGSEVFRAAHNAGAVISENLYNLFKSGSPSEAYSIIENSKEFKCLNRETYREEWDSLTEDLLNLPCFNKDYSSVSRNQRFYVFVFEELFRKYFGAEMVNQFKYLKNRTPFLDIDFLKAIFKTGLAGIHSGFFEHNPLKRYKGQVLYAHIIRKAYPAFGKMMTDKGYRPDDLIDPLGKINIAKGYLKKITRRVSPEFDPYGVSKAWATNRDHWKSIPVSSEYFNVERLDNTDKEILYKIISLSYLINSLPQSHEGAKFAK